VVGRSFRPCGRLYAYATPSSHVDVVASPLNLKPVVSLKSVYQKSAAMTACPNNNKSMQRMREQVSILFIAKWAYKFMYPSLIALRPCNVLQWCECKILWPSYHMLTTIIALPRKPKAYRNSCHELTPQVLHAFILAGHTSSYSACTFEAACRVQGMARVLCLQAGCSSLFWG
jgi:hypothetical protein